MPREPGKRLCKPKAMRARGATRRWTASSFPAFGTSQHGQGPWRVERVAERWEPDRLQDMVGDFETLHFGGIRLFLPSPHGRMSDRGRSHSSRSSWRSGGIVPKCCKRRRSRGAHRLEQGPCAARSLSCDGIEIACDPFEVFRNQSPVNQVIFGGWSNAHCGLLRNNNPPQISSNLLLGFLFESTQARAAERK